MYRSYEVFAQNSSVIDSECKSQFNAFQQNWTAFVGSWLKFIKQLNKELTGFEPLTINVNYAFAADINCNQNLQSSLRSSAHIHFRL